MGCREVLGRADVDDERLLAMVADQLGEPADQVEIVSVEARAVDYALPAITTAGRWWVDGQARAGEAHRPFRFFVKHVQSWARHPFFAQVPAEYRAAAAAAVPWRTEPNVYRSDLADRLPAGLTMPRSFGVYDVDDESAVVWLADVGGPRTPWNEDRFGRAARLLGRLAASPRVAPLAALDDSGWHVGQYTTGRLRLQVLPMLRDDGLWRHPLIAGAFDRALRDRLLRAADGVEELTAELLAAPLLVGHGDACPNNLLSRPGDADLVLIDFGFWGPRPIGFDLGQLVVGDVQLGYGAAADLPRIEQVCLSAYLEGLRIEGCDVGLDVVRRAHAVQLMLFTGLSALPFELLDAQPTPELRRVAAERAAIARFSLDLLAGTTRAH